MILPALLLTLDKYSSWRVGRVVPKASQRRQRQGTKTPLVTEWRKKPWEKPGSVGGPFLLWPDDTAVQFQLLQSQIGGLNWFPRSFPDGCLGDGVLTGGLSLGLI